MTGHRYVFVCGLHRSGTSLVARCLADHPRASGFKSTGVIEDEGQFLQTVLPLETDYGGVGRFGFDPRAHLTEASPVNTPDNARKLLSEWQKHWDLDKSVLVEKTPSNLLRMRLLSQFMQPSYFVIVTRHPVASSLAAIRWTEGNIFKFLTHWVHCYRIARADAAQLPYVKWVSYEAFTANPRQELDHLYDFVGLPSHDVSGIAIKNENEKYFDLWKQKYLGDSERAIVQKPPKELGTAAEKWRYWFYSVKREFGPAYRREANLLNFQDAQDAVALLEPVINEFGYSFNDFDRSPRSEEF
ncbi:MAG TPA: sulfotransferase [Rhizomicrobium sp.]|jgi:hypothetical protein|nr:sulfotransferase [Rhizomicrobium sp.]